MTAIPIVGAACMFPGAQSLEELWSNVLAQRPSFRAIPPHRLDLRAYAADVAEPAETIACRVAALVTGYAFPRERYRIPAATVRQVDLAHWLALDVAARAIGDAERRTGPLPRERTGVVVANTLTGEMSRANALRHRWPYVRGVVADALRALTGATFDADALLASIEERFKAPFEPMGDESLAGSLANTIAGRICNYFDFGGGGYVVDGACASSLVAIAQACAALDAGQLDAVVVGAVDVSLDPFELIGFSRLGALASDEMRVYAQNPSGFLPGEGSAFVVLRPDDRGRALARIRGVALSSDGAGGITRPELRGQLHVLRRAYAQAGVDPADVLLFEGHGTGTAVGDDVELRALRVLREACPPRTAYVGSVKTLLGHTKAAAGMAGMLKTLMALRRGVVPPHPSGVPHPALDATLQVTPCALPWPDDRPRLAGVSSFGFGGINAHVVLEGTRAPRRRAGLTRREARQSRTPQDAELVLVGAPDAGALAEKLAATGTLIAGMSRAELTDFAIDSAATARDDAHRAALIVERPWRSAEAFAALAARLGAGALDDHPAGAYYASARAAPRIALLFPGQASPVRSDAGAFGRRFPELDAPFAACAGGDASSTAVAQPAIVAASLAGMDALRSLGVDAHVAIGHSLGELVALHWAGAFTRATLVALARERGAVLQATCARGAMAAIFAGADAVRGMLRGAAVVACDNADDSCVVAGCAADVAATVDAALAAGVRSLRLPVATPFHSPAIEPAREPFRRVLAAHRFALPVRPLVSTVLGRHWGADDDVAETLTNQLVAPVRFREAFAALGAVDLAIEVGAGDTLRALVPSAAAGRTVALDVGGASVRGLLCVAGFLYTRTGDAGAARAMAAGRFARAPVLDAQRTVFANPCGSGVSDTLPPRDPVRAPAAPSKPSAVSPANAPVLAVARALVARRVELPVEMVGAGTRLLEDLHLSSLAAGQVVTDLATALGVPPPADLLRFATTTVGEMSAAFERDRAGAPSARPAAAAGVGTWVRRFRVVEIPATLELRAAEARRDWIYRSDARGALDDALRRRLTPAIGGERAYALLAGDDVPDRLAARLFGFAREVIADATARLALIVVHDAAGASFARSLALERPALAVYVATIEGALPPEDTLDALVAEAVATTSYGEIAVRAGRCFRRRLQLDDANAPRRDVLGADDVLLVSGGGKGIAAECAFARARTTGAALVLAGRSAPADDAALASNLERFERAGIRFRYVRADVRDRGALAAAVAEATAALGPVTAILHGAGINEPAALTAISLADVGTTIGVKVDGAKNLVAVCDPGRLREFVAFGSIIARTGMAGDAHYALANELLARDVEVLARAHPACRFVVAEWSIWSGVGMGERLGRVDALERIGIAPISPDDGVAAYLDLAGDPRASGAVVISGRFGDFPTLRAAGAPLPLGRFLERTLVHHPHVELVVEAVLAHATDPYLDEHRIDGLSVVPGVILIEAMAQTAAALLGAPPAELRDIVFSRPVIVPDGRARAIRVAALREGNRVRLELRTDETGFHFVHATATAHAETARAVRPNGARGATTGTLPSATDVYASILFHTGRFAGVRAYHTLAAQRCVATAAVVSVQPWFASAFPQHLMWGDAAVRDMAIHVLQACVPQTRVLPAAIGCVRRHAAAFPSEVVVDARQVGYDGESYVFDVTIAGTDGAVVETIAGLALRRSAAAQLKPIPPSLVATAIERRILDAGLGAIGVAAFAPPSGERWEKRPDGRPTNGSSRCYARDIELRCSGRALGIDAEFAGAATDEAWGLLIAGYRDAEGCARAIGGEAAARVRARLWCALEAAKKAESVTPGELSVRDVRADGITVFTTGRTDLATLCIDTTCAPEPLVVAIALPPAHAAAQTIPS